MSKLKIQQNTDLFKCPICKSSMKLHEQKSLICNNNHCFDLAKKGYVNFLSRPVKTEYDKEMLKSRNIICKGDFFKPLISKISEMVIQNLNPVDSKKKFVLDVGCGEGSHLDQVICLVRFQSQIDWEGVGIDISKAGIQIAAKEYPDNVWCVGDLANAPFQDGKFEVLLNILSPSNYAEFKRLMTQTGLLIKVVPGSLYLQELREAFYAKTAKETYTNEQVIELFVEKFDLICQEQVQYEVEMDQTDLNHLIKMTPLSWKIPEEKIKNVLNSGLNKITVQLTILCGKLTN